MDSSAVFFAQLRARQRGFACWRSRLGTVAAQPFAQWVNVPRPRARQGGFPSTYTRVMGSLKRTTVAPKSAASPISTTARNPHRRGVRLRIQPDRSAKTYSPLLARSEKVSASGGRANLGLWDRVAFGIRW